MTNSRDRVMWTHVYIPVRGATIVGKRDFRLNLRDLLGLGKVP